MNWVSIGIEAIVLLISVVSLYWKMKLEIRGLQLEYKDLKDCPKKLEELTLIVSDLKTEESLKEKYQTQIIKDLLTPVIKDITENLSEYVDVKMRIIMKEVDYIKQENLNFKNDVKELFKEFKEHTEKTIDRLAKISKNQING